MKTYVAGFAFDKTYKDNVLLIRKARPDWQAGKLNAIGGKIEPFESPVEAIEREFREETGITSTGWTQFCKLRGHDYVVYFFYNLLDIAEAKSTTDEEVGVYSTPTIRCGYNVTISNLPWLITMALEKIENGYPKTYYEVTAE